jgi:2-polyprenyl-6-methoxyphenol hydroxylase-like FAD-dependent oxidoreductase
MGVQARTLEFYRMFGIAEGAVSLGVPVRSVHVKVRSHERALLSLDDMGSGQSPFPFLLTLAQDVHERYLLERLVELGVAPEWNTELLVFAQDADLVTVSLRGPDKETRKTRTPWLIGCDGAHSRVRTGLEIGFSGGKSEGLFYVADVDIEGSGKDVYVGLDADTLGLMMPVRTTGTQRLIGIVPDDMADRTDLTFDDLRSRAEELIGVRTGAVNWFSTYRVQHRVADRFRAGRCFIAGDAGHIHSPVGGQGMNTGLGDAMNLAWKLAAVANGKASPVLLDSYEVERRAFARALIATTDSAFQMLTAKGWPARALRLRMAPLIVAAVSKLDLTRRTVFRAISQTRIAYPDSPLSQGRAGSIKGGDRLPWIPGADNFAPLDGLHWSVQVCGAVEPEFAQAVATAGLRLHVVKPDAASRALGFRQGTALLLRPDGHVGLALPNQSAEALRAYQDRLSLPLLAPSL